MMQGSGDDGPEDGTGDDGPEDGTGDDGPEDGTGDDGPEDGTGNDGPEDGTGNDGPEEEDLPDDLDEPGARSTLAREKAVLSSTSSTVPTRELGTWQGIAPSQLDEANQQLAGAGGWLLHAGTFLLCLGVILSCCSFASSFATGGEALELYVVLLRVLPIASFYVIGIFLIQAGRAMIRPIQVNVLLARAKSGANAEEKSFGLAVASQL
jgi:hypothetical protein